MLFNNWFIIKKSKMRKYIILGLSIVFLANVVTNDKFKNPIRLRVDTKMLIDMFHRGD